MSTRPKHLSAADSATFTDAAGGGTRYTDAFRRHWTLILAMGVIAVTSAAGYSLTADERFESQSELLVTPVSADDPVLGRLAIFRESIDETRSLITAARLTGSPQVAQRVAETLNYDGDPEALLTQIEVQPLGQSNLVSIKATATNAEKAAELANAFSTATLDSRTEQFQLDLQAAITRLQTQLGALPAVQQSTVQGVTLQQNLAALRSLIGAPDPTLRVFSEAQVPAVPVWPRPALSIAVAFLAAMLLGSGIALGLEVFNPRVTREDELLLNHRLPILARIPRMGGTVVRGYLSGRNPLPPDVRESYRTLRANLAAAGADGNLPRTILVTSAMPGEGKTLTSINLAMTLASTGLRVVLADADLRRPMISAVLGLPSKQNGFVRLMLDRTTVEDALTPAPGFGDRLQVLPATPESAYLVDLLDPKRVANMLEQLKQQADVVVIDSAPVTEVADALTIADTVDAILVAVRLGRTRRDRLIELRRLLAQRGVAPTGLVVTTAKRPRQRGYYTAGAADVGAAELSRPLRAAGRSAERTRQPSD